MKVVIPDMAGGSNAEILPGSVWLWVRRAIDEGNVFNVTESS
ncbi:MAG: hypothetical protein U9N46_13925 [Euryarchaeota archaeon]|nr:hypothetical protein [Euryarchaeota archaeon]